MFLGSREKWRFAGNTVMQRVSKKYYIFHHRIENERVYQTAISDVQNFESLKSGKVIKERVIGIQNCLNIKKTVGV